jgi:PAS domain S-box-containing protein
LTVERSLRSSAPYAWSVLATGAAALLRAALAPVVGDHYPLGTFYAAVALIGWFWGVRPAVLAAVLGYFLGAYLFLAPRREAFWAPSHGLELLAYAAICAALIALVYRVYERQRGLDHALAAHASTRQALAESDARFKRYLDALPDIVYTWRADGSAEYVNPRWLECVGVEAPDGDAFSAHIPAEDFQMLSERRQEALNTGQPLRAEFRLRDRQGNLRWFLTRCVPIRDAQGVITGWVGASSDIDDEKRAARARDQASQRLEVLTHAMSVGVAHVNREMEYVWANPAYARTVGIDPEEVERLPGRKIEEVLGRAAFERLAPYFLRILAGEPVDYEGPLLAGTDPSRWVRATYTPLWDEAPLPTGWVAVISDMTERRALEEQLRDTSRRKDEFLATLAHELRNPLAPIRYATQLMKPGTPPEMAADARRMIDRQLAHMARLLDDLLDVSRISRGTLQIQRDTVDLCAVIRHSVEAARPLAEAVEQELRLECPDYPLLVTGDETRLIQVIGNLINNAIKFTSAGGKILICAAIDDAMIVVRVADTGRGMSQELLPHVFEMFVQGEPTARAQTGLGIGLALAKQMVDLHGGRIEAHSEGPRRGSEFRVYLPRAAELPAMQTTFVDAAKVSVLGADSIRVLIVDDNVDAADALAQFLKLAGYQTRVAYDGRMAVEMAEILEPAVVLLDLGLPYLNGHEVARRLRTMPWGRSARLIALTGWGQKDDVLRSRQSGFDEHLTKPVDPEVLLQRIIQLTRSDVSLQQSFPRLAE